jgi:hypothetical protein
VDHSYYNHLCVVSSTTQGWEVLQQSREKSDLPFHDFVSGRNDSVSRTLLGIMSDLGLSETSQ